jgi:hypothetical protein
MGFGGTVLPGDSLTLDTAIGGRMLQWRGRWHRALAPVRGINGRRPAGSDISNCRPAGGIPARLAHETARLLDPSAVAQFSTDCEPAGLHRSTGVARRTRPAMRFDDPARSATRDAAPRV